MSESLMEQLFGNPMQGLVTVSCPNCGQVFCIQDSLMRARQKDGKRFYCPNGHPLVVVKAQKR